MTRTPCRAAVALGGGLLAACSGILGVEERYYVAGDASVAHGPTGGRPTGTGGGVEMGAGGNVGGATGGFPGTDAGDAAGGAGGSGGGFGAGGAGGSPVVDGGDVVPACAGKAPRAIVCLGMQRVECGPDLTTTTPVSTCIPRAEACIEGACVPCGGTRMNCDGVGGDCETDLAAPGTCGTSCGSTTSCPSSRSLCADGVCSYPPSCLNNLNNDCGPGGNESCCGTTLVTGGPFERVDLDSARRTARVSSFRLEKFEVTVGRYRGFIDAWFAGWRPNAGDGKHSHLNGGRGLARIGGGFESGWDPGWEEYVTSPAGDWTSDPPCDALRTMTGSRDYLPVNCVNWWEMKAFCIWDGAFLPSEAEWVYAAAGGAAQRTYPWGDTAPVAPAAGVNPTLAAWGCFYDSTGTPIGGCSSLDSFARPGALTLGNGVYGQSDLGGNIAEWTADYYAPYPPNCTDCVQETPATARLAHGGGFASAALLLAVDFRNTIEPDRRYDGHGARCARPP